ncbi:hypothetical protein HK098_006915, partial [Nowakowskiella sp. JEL0407]
MDAPSLAPVAPAQSRGAVSPGKDLPALLPSVPSPSTQDPSGDACIELSQITRTGTPVSFDSSGDVMLDTSIITDSIRKEEDRIAKESEKAEQKMLLEKSKMEYTQMEKTQRANRLDFLLNRAGAYSKILAKQLEANQLRRRQKASKSSTETPSESETGDKPQTKTKVESKTPERRVTRRVSSRTAALNGTAAASSSTTSTSTKRKVDSPTDDSSKKRRGRPKSTVDPVTIEEATEIIKSKDQDSKPSEPVKEVRVGSERQPKLVTGAVMREYQLVGLEWLISLYDNGLNGILGDEMGLGQTLQTIAFLAFLKEKKVHAPFLIVAPLNTIANWVSEFERFTPTIPVVLYHGTPEERSHIRNFKLKRVDENFPVVVTSYEICMNDRKNLQHLMWKYIVVDEGHRIKNLNCKLIQELKSYHSANRLLLTGTPLQNNLKELWSLLNFLMPDIFNDLDSFN